MWFLMDVVTAKHCLTVASVVSAFFLARKSKLGVRIKKNS